MFFMPYLPSHILVVYNLLQVVTLTSSQLLNTVIFKGPCIVGQLIILKSFAFVSVLSFNQGFCLGQTDIK